MLVLRPFSLTKPNSLKELSTCLADADENTKIMAGGTDLVPNLKHNLYNIDKIISLGSIPELSKIEVSKDAISLGAMVTLKHLGLEKNILKFIPSLSYAATLIASPQIRAMGTVGGNICLDTRCSYFNQTEFWRQALGFCLKKDGTECHVVKTGKRCVAASSNDLGTMLLAHDASLTIFSPTGERTLKLSDLYTANGEKNNVLSPNEIVKKVWVSVDKNFSGFAKLRHRQSFDFGLLSIGTCFSLDNNFFISGRLVVNALVAKPKIFDLSTFQGRVYNEALVDEIAVFAREKCHPQDNMAEDKAWRRDMIIPFTKRAFYNARSFETLHHAF